jgi:hypothetical protein
MFWKDYCGYGAIYRMCLAGVHSLASSFDLFLIAGLSSDVESSSACFTDSRRSEIVSINLITTRSSGTPNMRMAKINNRRNELAGSIFMIHAGESFTERGREIRTSLPQNLIRKVMLIKARRLISFYDGLRDADERDQADNDQNLYQHRIPQPHNLLLWRENLVHNPLNRDPTTGNKLIYEHDRGDN